MKVASIGIRRRHLAVLVLSPQPDIEIIFTNSKQLKVELEKQNPLIDRTILERCKIAVNDELNNTDIYNLVKVSQCYRAKERAIWQLSQGDRSKKSLYNKLYELYGSIPAQFAVNEMEKRGYINDENYAMRLAQSLNERNISRRAAKEKLYQKGVPPQAIETALQAVFDEDETQKALAVIKKSYINKLSDEQSINKTIQALVRKGFSFAAIKSALQQINL